MTKAERPSESTKRATTSSEKSTAADPVLERANSSVGEMLEKHADSDFSEGPTFVGAPAVAISRASEPPDLPPVHPTATAATNSQAVPSGAALVTPAPGAIPIGSPEDDMPAPGKAPRGEIRSMRRSNEFALVYRSSSAVVTRSGLVGKRGTWRVVDYPTTGAAGNGYAKECSRWLEQGFVDVDS